MVKRIGGVGEKSRNGKEGTGYWATERGKWNKRGYEEIGGRLPRLPNEARFLVRK